MKRPKIIFPASAGARIYLAMRGGVDVPAYLGSASTFTLGRFGGHGGRALRVGDVLHVGDGLAIARPASLPKELIPAIVREWEIGVLYGPHGAPDFFTDDDIATFFATAWEVHYNSNRTGVRLIGPKPQWARTDGGEAGLHPSNIHDNAYAIGAVDFTGDMPVILGPDGPSLGGFVCPVTIVAAELWKLGQLRSGDKVRFKRLAPAEAYEREARQIAEIETLKPIAAVPAAKAQMLGADDCIVESREASGSLPRVVYRRAGDKYLLVEYGPIELDLELRFRVHVLMTALERRGLEGIIDLTPGIRSLQVHYDSRALPLASLLQELSSIEDAMGDSDAMEVPSRIVHMPLSWDDAATQLAVEKYMQSVRADAPWCPSNIEFIRRINGLKTHNIFPNDKLKVLTGQILAYVNKTNLTLTLYINNDFIKEYRISVGDPTKNCDTPAGTYTIGTKTIHPTWYKKTEDGRKEEVPYGDKRNVLGTRWMAFKESPALGIHGTTQPESIGKKISNGCVRMYNAEVEEVYDLISEGARVVVEE